MVIACLHKHVPALVVLERIRLQNTIWFYIHMSHIYVIIREQRIECTTYANVSGDGCKQHVLQEMEILP